jgi:glycosyltransferase involved in cell wall biosynthesis
MLAGMRVQIIDPPAFTPPYDRSLCAALARAGAEVELVTSRFLYGPVPSADGYRVTELFYPRTARRHAGVVRPSGALAARARQALRLSEHLPGMLAHRRHAANADVVHYQWLSLEALDGFLLARRRPRVLTAHNVLPHERRRGQRAARRRLVRRVDAVVVHSQSGAERLSEELGLDPARVRVIPHGVFDYLTRLPEERPLPDELARVEGPVVLCFGLMRPYKGIDVLLEAAGLLRGTEIWVVGMPRMPVQPLRERAARAAVTVRFVPRFISDSEVPAYFRRADVVVLPYREVDQSGVLYTALAFARPLVLTRVGGFVDVGEGHGAARLVPPGDSGALAEALHELVSDRAERDRLSVAAERAATGPYSWERVAQRTLALYRELLSA